jgi:hypothetical protein
LAVDQLIIGHAMGCQKLAHKAVVFGGNPQPKPVPGAKCPGGGVQIIQRVDVNPRIRHRDDQIGMAKAQSGQFGHLHVPIGQLVTHKV